MIRESEPNFLYLFIGMVALLLGAPLVEALIGHRAVIVGQLAMSTLLLLGVWTLAVSRAGLWVGMVLVAASVGGTALAYVRPTPQLSLASLAIAWTFCLLSILLCIRNVVTPGRVTANHLLGAICLYLLLGALWGFTYAAVQTIRPGALRLADDPNGADLGDCMYFSFVTLTTTGYGDIVPVNRLLRTLAFLEGAAGQLYVAILIATLVSRYVAPHPDPPPGNGGHDSRPR